MISQKNQKFINEIKEELEKHYPGLSTKPIYPFDTNKINQQFSELFGYNRDKKNPNPQTENPDKK